MEQEAAINQVNQANQVTVLIFTNPATKKPFQAKVLGGDFIRERGDYVVYKDKGGITEGITQYARDHKRARVARFKTEAGLRSLISEQFPDAVIQYA